MGSLVIQYVELSFWLAGFACYLIMAGTIIAGELYIKSPRNRRSLTYQLQRSYRLIHTGWIYLMGRVILPTQVVSPPLHSRETISPGQNR